MRLETDDRPSWVQFMRHRRRVVLAVVLAALAAVVVSSVVAQQLDEADRTDTPGYRDGYDWGLGKTVDDIIWPDTVADYCWDAAVIRLLFVDPYSTGDDAYGYDYRDGCVAGMSR